MIAITSNYGTTTGGTDLIYDDSYYPDCTRANDESYSNVLHFPAQRKTPVAFIPTNPATLTEYWPLNEGVGRGQYCPPVFRLPCNRRARSKQWTGKNFRKFK